MARSARDYVDFGDSDLKRWRKNLEKQFEEMEGDLQKKLEDAGAAIKKVSDEYVPEDTLETKNSWYERVEAGDGYIRLVFGYDEHNQIDYLPLIYLNPENKINFRKTGAKSMWLDHAVADTRKQVDNIITAKTKK